MEEDNLRVPSKIPTEGFRDSLEEVQHRMRDSGFPHARHRDAVAFALWLAAELPDAHFGRQVEIWRGRREP